MAKFNFENVKWEADIATSLTKQTKMAKVKLSIK